jgi:hypothetical protein
VPCFVFTKGLASDGSAPLRSFGDERRLRQTAAPERRGSDRNKQDWQRQTLDLKLRPAMAKRSVEFVLPVGQEKALEIARGVLRDRQCQITATTGNRLVANQSVAVGMGVPVKFTFDLKPAAEGTRVTVVASRFGLLAPPGTARSLEELRDTVLYEVSREGESPKTTDP